MPVLLLLVTVLVVGAIVLLAGNPGSDTPARLVAAATRRIPADRQDWGQAMAAELAHVQGRAGRWRFAAGVLRVVAFPPVVHRGRVIAVALVGLALTAAVTATAALIMPILSVFVATLGLVLGAYATVLAARSGRRRPSAPQAGVALLGLVGVGGAIAAVVRIAAAHPAAAADDTHIFSIVFALALAGYVVAASSRPRPGTHTGTVLWAAIGGAVATALVWVAIVLATSVAPDGIISLLSPVAAVATLAVGIGVAASTGSWRAGARAGALTAILGAPIRVAIDLTSLLQAHHYALTTPYDLAAFQRSGLPDVASYILSDALGGEILAGLILVPLVLITLAVVGAAAGAGLHHRSAGHPRGGSGIAPALD